MAEGYLKSLELKDISVKSRGLSATGEGASENSVKAMKALGLDISGHISQQITKEDIAWADRIICMSQSHKMFLEALAKEKLSVLGKGVLDPFGCDLAVYTQCRDEIILAINEIFIPFTVRSIERDDIKQIAQLEKVCFSEAWSTDTLLEAYTSGTRFFIANKDNKVLGYAGINCVIDEGYITNVAVFPEYRKRGVATAILNAVFDLAKELNLSFVSLEVRVSNSAAISLYEKVGFKKEAVRPNFYSNPKEDAYIMTKRFG
jgi:ribosomal-protein-alanine N-acetyltransferase